jgi:hypothetical protein
MFNLFQIRVSFQQARMEIRARAEMIRGWTPVEWVYHFIYGPSGKENLLFFPYLSLHRQFRAASDLSGVLPVIGNIVKSVVDAQGAQMRRRLRLPGC